MYQNKIIPKLIKNRNLFKELLRGFTKEEYLWKPKPKKWCLLEILCHLYDEEREDFRERTKHVLETPTKPLPKFNPLNWVQERAYISQDYAKTLENFLNERTLSIQWLKSLTSPKWDNAYQHSKFGPMSAKMFLTNWVAHDYLHIRQIIKLKFESLQLLANQPITYAGKW